MKQMNDVEHSYKRLSFFKRMVDELISLSFFLEGEGSMEEQNRIVMLGRVMDDEVSSEVGIISWIANNFPLVKAASEKELNPKDMPIDQQFILNHYLYAYKILQWWLSDEDEPSDEFLNWYNKYWIQLEKEYGAYIVKHRTG